MRCSDTNQCFEQISAYFNGDKTGYFFIVNTENYDVYQEILQRLQADNTKRCIYISDNCLPIGLPDIDSTLAKASTNAEFALIGLSQALMLQTESALEERLDEILTYSIRGHGIILLDHCEQILQKYLRRDIRLQTRVVLAGGKVSILPQIRLAKKVEECVGYQPISSLQNLLAYLEHLSDTQRKRHPEITVVSSLPYAIFKNAVYSVKPLDSVYKALSEKYSDILGGTEEHYGTNEQWLWLAEKMKKHDSFSSFVCESFGSTSNLSSHLNDILDSHDTTSQWFLWLSMKVFGESNNKYLTLVIDNCNNFKSFHEHIYLDFVDTPITHADFTRYYNERKKLLKQLPENLPLVSKYCEKLGKHQKDEIFYLTNSSDAERFEFVRCLSTYNYTDEEIDRAAHSMSSSLSLYLKDFVFDSINTKLPESDSNFRSELTSYFRAYKRQKLTNRIYPEHLEKVHEYALTRPYNKTSPRSSIISHMDRKNTQLFFFDALGVEYLSFIKAKCEEFGLILEIAIGHCELPSITKNNKEFLQYFDNDNCHKIDVLDEIKHHSQVYNYQKCKYPLHLFEELDVIESELRKIQSMLVQGTIDKALIVSDHGASRLAVLYGHENPSKILMDESGEHSGRCCSVDEDPDIEFAAYENGFSSLANYERFKGGRAANVEVHGGASLEEVLVPIITLTKRPENIEICFVEPVITLIPRIIPELLMYSNISLKKPYLLINGDFIKGTFAEDNKHIKFSLPKIKRKGTYSADVYDGKKNMSVTIKFTVQKQTREVSLL